MQIDYFDLDNTSDAQKVAMPWPLRFAAFNCINRGRQVRVYYTPMPGNTEQTGTFYFIKTNQDLPETFPAKLISTIFTNTLTEGDAEPDDAVHVFFETPVNNPKKPRVLVDHELHDGGGDNGE